MSANYGIKENYLYIKENLKSTHLIFDSKVNELINLIQIDELMKKYKEWENEELNKI